MDMTEITNLITTIGFPISACIVIYKQMAKNMENQREDSLKREEKLINQLNKFGESLNAFDNTLKSIDKRLKDIEYKINNVEKEQ